MQTGLPRQDGASASSPREIRSRADGDFEDLEAVDEAAVDLRYVGQEYSLTVPVPLDPSSRLIALSAAELADYSRRLTPAHLGTRSMSRSRS